MNIPIDDYKTLKSGKVMVHILLFKGGKMKKPKVSVIVPTKNSESFLYSCLRSIANQSYAVETIVVDNYSTDRTVKIAKRFTKKVYSRGPERSS